jgi:hypothetical protein
MQFKQAILVLGELQNSGKELKDLEQDAPYAIVKEPWPATRAELIEKMKALAEQWTVEAVLLLLGGHQFNPLNKEIFAPFVPRLRLVCGIAAGGWKFAALKSRAKA